MVKIRIAEMDDVQLITKSDSCLKIGAVCFVTDFMFYNHLTEIVLK